MKLNVGGMDRILRMVAGLILIALAATGTVGLWPIRCWASTPAR
jgi:Protein of unknown function (DUF2892)